MKVSAPDGRDWDVSRRWIGRKVAVRWVRVGGLEDALNPGAVIDTSVGGVLIGIAVLVVAAAVILFVLPLLILLVQILVILLLIAAGIAARVLFRRPWEVDAVTPGPPPETHVWRIVGWRNSSEAIREAAQALRQGMVASSPGGARPVPGEATPGPTPSRSVAPPGAAGPPPIPPRSTPPPPGP
jgi:hypothetical protein